CLPVEPVLCFYRFDASSSMGDDLTYSWSVYYPDSNNLIDNSVHFSSTTPVFETSLAVGFTAVNLFVLHSCGSSACYMGCSDWFACCLDLAAVDQGCFGVEGSGKDSTLKVNSSFTFATTGDILIDFGAGGAAARKGANGSGSISH